MHLAPSQHFKLWIIGYTSFVKLTSPFSDSLCFEDWWIVIVAVSSSQRGFLFHTHSEHLKGRGEADRLTVIWFWEESSRRATWEKPGGDCETLICAGQHCSPMAIVVLSGVSFVVPVTIAQLHVSSHTLWLLSQYTWSYFLQKQSYFASSCAFIYQSKVSINPLIYYYYILHII